MALQAHSRFQGHSQPPAPQEQILQEVKEASYCVSLDMTLICQP